MREILFRGKRKDNGEWVYGDLRQYSETQKGIYDYNLRQTVKGIITETIGQYTGLTDRNGKRIFEGDIGRYKQTDGAKRNGEQIICIGKVVYNAKTASYAVNSKDDEGCKYFDYFAIKDFEIIGNIYDNPELIGGEEQC